MSRAPAFPAFLNGEGEMPRRVRAFDWSRTSLGPIDRWSHSLRATVGALLHSRHPMFLWWGPELIQLYNDAYLPSFGVGKHPTALGQPGRACWDEIWPIIGPQIDDVMQRGKPCWNEDQLVPIARNGRLEEVYWTYGYSPVFDDDGSIGGTLVVCTETTARVVAERRLRTLRDIAERTAFAASPADVLDNAAGVLSEAPADLPFGILYTFDWGSGVAERDHAWGLSDPALAALDAVWRPALTRGSVVALPSYGPLLLPDGARPTVATPGLTDEPVTHVFLAPLAEAGPGGASGCIVFGLSPRLSFNAAYSDHLVQISQQLVLAIARVEAFRIRAATEGERNNLLLQAPAATALLTGPTHVFRLANARYRELVGKERVLDGRTYLEAFPEAAGTELVELLDRVYAGGQPFVAREMRALLDRRGDGTREERVVDSTLEPMRDLDGQVYGLMAFAVDVTEQVEARRVLEQAQEERDRLLEDLRTANRAKDEFLAMLGHELRNPLSPIVTALGLMKLRGDHQHDKERAIIERQVTHLVRLVDDLLDISKITRGKIELRRETVELSEVLAKAVEMASLLLEQRRHQLDIDVTPGIRWQGDPVRLAQVVSNLLTNAARYTDVGGRIGLSARSDGDDIVIGVRDNGNGIAPEVLPHVFDLFYQVKRSHDRAEGGLGIGLSLVKNLVALHGGTVAAHSDGLGQGSEFTLRLPLSPSVLAPADGDPAGPAPTVATARRVLVVDDNADAAELLSEMLSVLGHEVAVAHDPLAALALAQRFAPEVAVLDVGLPVMDGYELGGKLRELLTGTPCRLIALTGYGQDHDRDRSRAAGFAGHLVKPLDIDKLLAIIASG